MSALLSIISMFLLLPVEPTDTVMLQAVDVVSSVKFSGGDAAAHSSTSLGAADIEGLRITSVKELTAIAPNYYQPDYGSRMTSSIYVRGFGSRIDQPVVGMNIDDVPVLNKNCYDTELFDLASIDVLRGAQGVLYGRNTSGGAINLRTLSPLNFQGKRLLVEYGNQNTIRLKAAHYAKCGNRFAWSASLFYSHSDGFFMNEHLGEKCDGGDNAGVRLRTQWLPNERWSIDNSLTAGYTYEGGWAYGAYDVEKDLLHPVAYNEPCFYRRFTISDGLVVKRYFNNVTLSSTTGYRYMGDLMHIDNDFLPLDYFTMEQSQREHSVTQEFAARSHNTGMFNFMGGLFGFYKHNAMQAPVHFKKYGIENLILKNANENYYYHLVGDRELSFVEDNFIINDDFLILSAGASAYLQGGFSHSGFDVKAGLRVDYEYSMMNYDSRSTVHYSTYNDMSDVDVLDTEFKGSKALSSVKLLPSLSISYGGRWGNVYASARRGFKAGGFNTQLFSDILQGKMIGELIGNEQGVDASSTVYKPETNWTYELGTHLSPLFDDSFKISAALFYIDCSNQQLTVFPPGEGTGRMMSNAGKSFSTGVELALKYSMGRFSFDGSFGPTYARFIEYKSGDKDYAGNFLPLAPRETVAVNVLYSLPVARGFADSLQLRVGWNGIGRIYWNEENTLSQPFYGLLRASLAWEKGAYGVSLWASNILNEQYTTFYFRSIGNDFFSQGKPFQLGASFNVNL